MTDARLSILHLLSGSKWTGPAMPAANLAQLESERGHRVAFACVGGGPLEQQLRDYSLEVITRFDLRPRTTPWRFFHQVKRLRAFLREEEYNVIHAHLSNDNWLAALALRGVEFPYLLVRTQHQADPPRRDPFHRWLFQKKNDLLIVICRKSANEFRSAYRLPENRTATVFGSVSLERFSPSVSGAEIREELHIPSGDTVVGMVSRLKAGREHELAIRAFAIASRRDPKLHLALVGGGELRERLLRLVSEQGLGEKVRFTGRRVEDLPQVYAAMDFVLYLNPGSDGTCRALLESAASGKPAIGLRRGAIPEILEHNRTGLLVEEVTPEALAENINLLSRNADRTREMGIFARRNAAERFHEEREYRETQEAYTRARQRKYPRSGVAVPSL